MSRPGLTGSAAVRIEAPQVAVRLADDGAAWDAYVSSRPDASAYHVFAWRDLIARAFGHDTRYLVAESERRIVGILPLVVFRSRVFGRYLVSLPFVNYGGVVANFPEAGHALLEAAIVEARSAQADYLELRHTGQHFPELQAKRHKVAMEVPLRSTEEDQWQAIDRKVRNQVRKGQKSGLRIVIGGAELITDFYGVFAVNMRDLGTPVYTRRWFDGIVEALAERTRLFVVYSGPRPVAAAVVHWHGSRIEVPWASALRESNALCANVFMYWEMFRFAVERGFERFDLGRSTPGEGTFNFKKQWGAEPRELVWEYWTRDGMRMPDLSVKNPRYQRAIAVWQRLPVGLTRVIGPPIVRHIA
jgi:FemAB-related protein (PEP-CTERM system-associated)